MSVDRMNTLYHWSPRARLNGIKRLGLVPGKRNIEGPTYHDPDNPSRGEFRQSGVCFSPDPATAWVYTHRGWGLTGETFDLWLVIPVESDVVKRRRDNGRVVEVRIHNRIPKSRLVWIGERVA